MRWLLAQAQQKKNERAFVLPFLAVMIVVLLGITGFAVDIGNWYLHVQRAQKSADSAALSGAVYLPGNVVQAKAAVKNELKNNGFTGTDYENQVPGHPILMGVRVNETVDNQFLSLFGYKTFSFTRQAVAGERIPLKMGSPSNVIGEEPTIPGEQNFATNTGFDTYMNYSANVFGKDGQVNLGDAYDADNCHGIESGLFYAGRVPSICTSSASSGANTEYDDTGAPFRLHLTSQVYGQLAVEVYDGTQTPGLDITLPAGDTGPGTGDCQDYLGRLAYAYTASGLDPHYDPKNASACMDDSYDGDNTAYPSVNPGGVGVTTGRDTRFTIYSVDGTGKQTAVGSCPTADFPAIPDSTDVASVWNAISAPTSNPFAPKYAFHRWARLCTLNITAGSSRDYDLIVKGGANAQYNSFRLRAYFVGSALNTESVELYPKDRMSVNTHGLISGYQIPLAQLNQGSLGNTVTLKEFDVADTMSDLVRIAPNSGGSISCDLTRQDGTTQHLSPCQLTNVHSEDTNAYEWTFKLNIPSTYSCNWNSPTDCWLVLTVDFTKQGVNHSDTASWALADNGIPLHLYDDSKYPF